MVKFVKSKVLLIAVALIFVLYLSNDFSLIDIKETALIVALGVDKEGDLVEVTAQLAVPKSSDQAANTPGTAVSGKGETVALAIENIGVRTGWYPRLSFCNLLVLGEGLMDEDVMETIDYFIRTVKIQDTARLCAADGKAKEVLNAPSPLDELSAFALNKILQKDGESSTTVTITSIREFAMGYYSKSRFSMMPLVKTVQTEGDNDAEGNQMTSFSRHQGRDSPTKMRAKKQIKKTAQNQKGGDNAQKKHVFDATTTLLFTHGRPVCTLDGVQTMILQLLLHKITEATVELKETELEGKSANVLVAMRQNRGRIRLDVDGGRPILHLRLRVVARIDDTNVTTNPSGLVSGYVVPENVLRDTERLIADGYREIFEMTRECGCDVFEITDRLYRTNNRYFTALEKTALRDAGLRVEVVVKSFK